MADTNALMAARSWIVLPTYCEAENLPILLAKIDQCMSGINVLIVDDNSPDGTADVAATIAAARPHLHVIRRPVKTGLGDAYMEGFRIVRAAGADFIVTMDADLSHCPDALPSMFSAVGKARCVVGSRYVKGGMIENWTMDRRLLSWAANNFVRLLFGLRAADCTSGYRLYRHDVIDALIRRRPISQGYSFQVEALTIASDGPSSVIEVPIRFFDRIAGRSKMGIHEIFGGARSLLLLWVKMNFGRALPDTVQNEYESCPTDLT